MLAYCRNISRVMRRQCLAGTSLAGGEGIAAAAASIKLISRDVHVRRYGSKAAWRVWYTVANTYTYCVLWYNFL